MLLLRKLSSHLIEQKLSYFLLLCLIFLGFVAGCFYANLISDTEFLQAVARAEQFIKEAKANELSFRLMLWEELSTYLLIALFSLFLFGFLPTVFLVFKYGFSSGFFLTFLVKCFALKGFFLGGMFLLVYLMFFLPSVLVQARNSLIVNKFLLVSVLNRPPSQKTLGGELLRTTLISFGVVLTVSLGVAVKFLLLTPLSNYLFL